MIKDSYRIIGIMSGTSLDGIDLLDVILTKTKGIWSYQILNFITKHYPNEWKDQLVNIASKYISEIKLIDHDYTVYLGSVIKAFIDTNKIENIDFISSHGHTALHQPEKRLTLQIGNQYKLAEILKLPVVCDFRVQDVKLGGQGAPLVPIGDALLFRSYDFCVNLGGFANLSYYEDGKRIAYDICPCNIVLNHIITSQGFPYDDKGNFAAKGELNLNLLEELNSLSYYNNSPPKSLGIEWVNSNFLPILNRYKIKSEDLLRTCVEHFAFQISKSVGRKRNAKILITGGGAFNDFLIQRIGTLIKTDIKLPKKEIIEYKEALVFALLGVLRWRNEINCLSSVTGANHDHSSGIIHIPKNYRD